MSSRFKKQCKSNLSLKNILPPGDWRSPKDIASPVVDQLKGIPCYDELLVGGHHEGLHGRILPADITLLAPDQRFIFGTVETKTEKAQVFAHFFPDDGAVFAYACSKSNGIQAFIAAA